jgi:hypothetical protein
VILLSKENVDEARFYLIVSKANNSMHTCASSRQYRCFVHAVKRLIIA